MTMQFSSASEHTVFSRRSRRARYAATRGGRNDWIWLVGFGVVIIAMVGGFFAFSGAIGGSSTCSNPLAPLGDRSPLSDEAFQTEDTSLSKVISLASSGDRTGAENAFYGDVHNFTHNVDKPLREKNAALGKNLCHSVLDLEEALTSQISAIDLSTKVQVVRDYLRDAAAALGYKRPSPA